MADDKFTNLDKLILDQPDFINLNEDGSGLDPEPDNDQDDDNGDDKIKAPKAGKEKPAAPVKKELITIENEEEDEDPTPAGNEPSGASQEELITGWADHFKENTILTEADLVEFDGTEKGLSEAFNKMKIREGLEMVESYKEQLPQVLKYLADNWEDGVPLNELLNIKSNQIKYANLTDEKVIESVDTQKQVYAEYLKKTTKYSDAKIEKEVARLVDLDELKEEALDAVKEMKKHEAEAEDTIRRETKAEQVRREAANAAEIKTYEKLVKDTKEVIPGIAVDAKVHEDILKKIIKPIGIDGNGMPVSYIQSIRNEDPYAFDIKLNYLMTITKGMTDFSKIVNTAETKATKNINSLLESKAPKGTNAGGVETQGKKSVLEYLAMPQNKRK